MNLAALNGRLGRRLSLLLLLVLLAAILTNLATYYHPRFLHHSDSVDSQLAILERRPFVFEGIPVDYTSWRSRLLIPIIINFSSNVTGLSFSQSYLLFRFIGAMAALGAFALLSQRQLGPNIWSGGFAACLLTLALIPTFIHIYDIPTDFPDAACFSLLLLCAMEKRRGWFAAIFMLAIFNRESALFALPVWLVLHALPVARKHAFTETAYCGLLGITGIALILGLRSLYAIYPPLEANDVIITQPVSDSAQALHQVAHFLAQPSWSNGLFFLFGYLAFFGLMLAQNWHLLNPSLRHLAWLTLGIFAASVPMANLPEIRVYIPSLVLGTFILLAVLLQRLRPANASR